MFLIFITPSIDWFPFSPSSHVLWSYPLICSCVWFCSSCLTCLFYFSWLLVVALAGLMFEFGIRNWISFLFFCAIPRLSMACRSPCVPVLFLFHSLNFWISYGDYSSWLVVWCPGICWVFLETYNCFRLLSVIWWRSFASVLVLNGFLFGPGSARGALALVAFWSFHGSFLRCMDIQ